MSFQTLSVEYPQSNILIVRLMNAEEKYTFSERVVADLLSLFEKIKTDEKLAALILTGSEKYFCTGGDLRAMQNLQAGMFGGTPEEIEQKYQQGIQRVINELYHLPMPTIAAINGAAVGAGLGLALACDMRIAVKQAKLAESFTRIGLIAGDGDAWLLPRLVGYANAAYLTFTSDMMSAEKALQIGLVNDVCDVDTLLTNVLNIAERIADHPIKAVRQMKQLLQQSERQSLAESLQAAAKVQGHLHHSVEHQQKVAELLLKTKTI
ncbi:MAG: echA4 [Gammaproteobacteria bacterium]|nr:echA4 [Gammaproteobacteria bacterium]